MKIYVVSSRRDDRVIGVYSTLERAQAEGAEYTEDLQARKGVAVNWVPLAWEKRDNITIVSEWKDSIPYDGEDYEVWIEEWELDQ